jgi:alpha-N-arabinofuranosidase
MLAPSFFFAMNILLILPALLLAIPSAHARDEEASITVEADLSTTAVNPLLFGHNVLFSGNGMWNTRLNDLDPEAARLIKTLSPTIVRFPGGSISDLYIWEDGLGYRTAAPVRPTDSAILLEVAPAWNGVQKARFIDAANGPFGDLFSFTGLTDQRLEGVQGLTAMHTVGAEVRLEAREGQPDWISNTYGIDEHMKFAAQIGAQVILTVNYGTGMDKSGKVATTASLSQRVKRAAAWVAYLNGDPADTRPLGVDGEGTDWQTVGYWAQRRATRGHTAPYHVRYWEVGNEVFGKWETGYTTARQYATDFSAFSTAMKAVDSTIKVGAVGMSDPHGRGDADNSDEWNATVMRIAGSGLDFVSVHPYYPSANLTQARGSFANTAWFTAIMAGSQQALADLRELRSIIAAHTSSPERIQLAVTEYGIWPADSHDARDYSNLARALFDADLLLALLQQSSQLGVLLATAWNLHGSNETAAFGYNWATGRRTVRPQAHAFQLLRSALKPDLVKTAVQGPTFQTAPLANVQARSAIPVLVAVATRDTPNRRLNLVVLNRGLTKTVTATIHLNGLTTIGTATVQTLQGTDLSANAEGTVSTVGVVTSQLIPTPAPISYAFPPHSLSSLEFSSLAASSSGTQSK